MGAVLAARRAGDDLALHTSGSSGAPRTVVRSSDSWWRSFEAYSELTGVGPGARVWIPGPMASTMNLFAAVHAHEVGAALTPLPRAATHACLTPALLGRRLCELSAGTSVVVAGAALSPGLHRQATARGLRLCHYYGAAELSFVACGPHALDLRAFPGVSLRIHDGEIQVRSPYLARGLHGWVGVGDRGRLEDGRLVVLGRPGAISSAGATIALADVESVLTALTPRPVAVLGVPREPLGEVLAAVVTTPADRRELSAHARELLPATHRPRLWRVVEELPLTAAGKPDRAALGELFS